MIFNRIISQYDDHNEALLFLVDKFCINEIIFILNESDKEKIEENKKKCSKVFSNIEIVFKVIKEESIDSIECLINKYDKSIINLSGGKRIISLLLLEISLKLGVQSIYVDFINKRRYVFRDKCSIINSDLKDISLQEIFYLSGADIVNETTSLCNKEDVIDISKRILFNITLWHKYKYRLYDSSIFKHDCKDLDNIEVYTNKLNVSEKELLNKSITYLKNINGIDKEINKDVISVKFKNKYLKSFLFKSGTWLEVITYLAVKKIKEIDEVRCGVLFSWAKNIKNEVDVVAIKDSVLIYISCKDSNKYDEDALNELSIYSERLGGKDVVKILVASRKPEKVTVLARAKEMNINLVILEDNKSIDYLERVLRDIINTSIK